MKVLTVFINDEIAYEYDRDMLLDEQRLAFLDRMDSDMNRGLKIQGELIANPDVQQRGRFVAMNLIKALQQNNEAVIAASSAYLINRIPALVEVRVNDHGNTVKLDLVQAQ